MDEVKATMPPATIEDAELIDRVVYEPSFFCDGRLSPSAFALTGKGETYISVFRNNYYNFTDVTLPKPRTIGDRVAGIAQLITSKVRAITAPSSANLLSVTVESKATSRYPFHAGISTKVDGMVINAGKAHTTPLFMYVQKELVRMSRLISKGDLFPKEA